MHTHTTGSSLNTSLVPSISEDNRQAEALSTLAQALTQAHLWDQAEAIWKLAEHIARSLPEGHLQTKTLGALAEALARAHLWDQAEKVTRSISDHEEQAKALTAIAEALAQDQQWQHAEEVVHSIFKSDQQAKVLTDVIVCLFTHEEYERGYTLIERSWLQAETSTYALTIFPSAVKALVPLKPALGQALSQEFQWVESFLYKPVMEHGEEEFEHTGEALRHEDDPTLDA